MPLAGRVGTKQERPPEQKASWYRATFSSLRARSFDRAQDDGLLSERFSQKSKAVRATRWSVAPLLFLTVFLVGAPLVISAQTTSPVSAPTDTASGPVIQPSFIPATPQGAGPKQEDIEDIRPPFFYLHSWLLIWLALAVAALIALAIFLWQRFKPGSVLNPRTAYDLALEKLEKARALLQEENPVPYAVAVSEIIRTYLGQRFQNPSTRRTTEEFLRQMENDSATPLAAHRELLRDFLHACDMVKFARYQPTLAELEQVQERALTFVTATKPIPTPDQQATAKLSPATS